MVQTMAVWCHDLVLMPMGHNPCAVPDGIAMYSVNFNAAPRCT